MAGDDNIREREPFELAAATAAIASAALAAAGLFPGAEPVGRLWVMAVVVGLLAGWVSNLRVAIAVVGFAVLVYVGFLTHRYGDLTGDPAPWHAAPPAMVAAGLLGRLSRRRLRAPREPLLSTGPQPVAQFERAVQCQAGRDHRIFFTSSFWA